MERGDILTHRKCKLIDRKKYIQWVKGKKSHKLPTAKNTKIEGQIEIHNKSIRDLISQNKEIDVKLSQDIYRTIHSSSLRDKLKKEKLGNDKKTELAKEGISSCKQKLRKQRNNSQDRSFLKSKDSKNEARNCLATNGSSAWRP